MAITNQSTIDGAGCATSYPTEIFLTNQLSYPYLQVGDTIYTDAATTTALTGQANTYVGIINKYGTAYKIDGNGEVISTHASTCVQQ